MRTFEQNDSQGQLTAFEIDNSLIGRRSVCRIVESIPNAKITRRPKHLLSWFREEVFCEFLIDGEKFVAWEPYGDNSRYWIGPDPARYLPQTQVLLETFETNTVSRLNRWAVFLFGAGQVGVGILFLVQDVSILALAMSILMAGFGAYFMYKALNG